MQGKYLKPDGTIIEVLDFDEINKMVYVKKDELNREWIHDTVYNKWTKYDAPIYVPDIPAQMKEETPLIGTIEVEKPKRKKKTDETDS